MENIPIKIKDLSILTNSLIEKVQFLESSSLTTKYKIKIHEEMLKVVEKLKEFFNNNKTEDEVFNKQIERIFEQFDYEIHVLTQPMHNFMKCSEHAKTLLSSILKILGKKGCGILMTESYIKACLKALYDLSSKCNNDEVSRNLNDFKVLIEGFSSTTKMLKKYWHVIFLQSQKNSMMLCLSQICKGLPFLLKMIEARNDVVKKYILERLIQCFNKMLDELHANGELLGSNNIGSEFIQLMDSALYILNQLSRDTIDYPTLVEISNDSVKSLKPVVDELLCHAMSIAQVTGIENDYKSIIASSQKVLQEFEQLTSHIEEGNGPEIKLDAISLSEILCKLEQKVNTAVLRLVLEVFTHVNSPLKNMVNKCRIDCDKDNKYSEDLDALVSDFDSEMDKIMQIGLFAISCSTDVKRILGIKSCLASLESLEAELIPCLSALYVEPNSSNKTVFQFLIEQWLKEITELKILIDSILDPAAFCEVVENQVQERISSVKDKISSNFEISYAQTIIMDAVRYSKKLVKMLKTSAEEDDQENTEVFTSLLSNLQLAVQECEASIGLLSNNEDLNTNIPRVLKRCDLVLSSINKLLEYLVKLLPTEKSNLETTEDFEDRTNEEKSPFWNSRRLPQKNYYRLCASISETPPNPNNMEALTPFLTRGKLRTKERSILYVTPKRTQPMPLTPKPFDNTILQNRIWDNTPRSRNRSRCCKPLPLNLELGNSIDFEVTTILENLSELSHTFNQSFYDDKDKTVKEAASGEEKNPGGPGQLTSTGCRTDLNPEGEKLLGDKIRSQFSQTLNELTQNSSLTLSHESNQQFNTPDRLQDLKIVEQKINFLQNQVPDVFF